MTPLDPAPLGPPRGVLRPGLNPGAFQHQRQRPAPALAGLIEHYWHVGWDLCGQPAQAQATLPHPNVHLVLEQGQALIYGVQQGRFVRQLAGCDQVFGIKFTPGGFYPFYQRPLATLLDQRLAVAACLGPAGTALAAQLLAATGFEARCRVADAFWQQHLPAADPQVAHVNRLLAHIAQASQLVAVADVQAISGLNQRSLQRLFHQYVGIGPKWVIQRYRLHEAIAQVQAGKTLSWTALALDLGYFDQAHFGRDFRQLVGMSPGDYEKSLRVAAPDNGAAFSKNIKPKPAV
jgi:AraC-like DNA-binding protein